MKKIFSVILATVMVFVGAEAVRADSIAVNIDGDYVGFDVAPIMQNDRVLVPMRAIFEELGASVDWDGNTQTVTAKADGKTISLQISSSAMTVNGQTITLDQPAVLYEGRTMVPVRAVSEALGADVGWDGTNATVNIDSGNAIMPTAAYFYKGNVYYYFIKDPAIYMWNGNTNVRYAAGGKVREIVVYKDYIFYSTGYSGNGDGTISMDKLCRMNLDGSDRRILATTPYLNHNGSDFVIRNDRVLYPHQDKDNEILRIYSVNLDGGDRQILTEDHEVQDFEIIQDPSVLGRSSYRSATWFVNKKYIYYGIENGGTKWTEPFYGNPFYRYSFEDGIKDDISDIGFYTVEGMDPYGNILLRGEDEDKYFTIAEPSKKVIPLSSLPDYPDPWCYDIDYEDGLGRTRPVSGIYEYLTSGGHCAHDDNNILFVIGNGKTDPDTYAWTISNQQFYLMDIDGNNIRLINEYNDGNGAQTSTTSNTSYDNSQSASQPKTCDVCHGLGYIECSICHGEGYVTRYTIAGTERKTCTSCGGRKQKSCIVCGGDGMIHD